MGGNGGVCYVVLVNKKCKIGMQHACKESFNDDQARGLVLASSHLQVLMVQACMILSLTLQACPPDTMAIAAATKQGTLHEA